MDAASAGKGVGRLTYTWSFNQAQKIIRSPNATHKDLEDGIEYLNAAIAMRPTNGRYYFARYVVSMAIPCCHNTHRHLLSAVHRANCLRSMGEFQRAFFDYSAAMRLDDSHGLYFCNRGICLRKVVPAYVGCVWGPAVSPTVCLCHSLIACKRHCKICAEPLT